MACQGCSDRCCIASFHGCDLLPPGSKVTAQRTVVPELEHRQGARFRGRCPGFLKGRCSNSQMLPVEPRLKPLGATMLHYADDREAKTEFKRCHSFSGYIPYALSDAATDCKSECSWEEASTCNVVWPDTDDEAPGQAPAEATGTGLEPTSTGGKVIVGFGRALQKAVKDMEGHWH